MAPTRGCGRRVAGGCYAVTELSPVGLPLEHFIYCHPLRVPDIGLSAQGQVLKTRDGAYGPETLMFDHIGEGYYPNVCDFLEEGRRFGFSWHITPDTASKLTAVSWAMPVHPRAFIINWRELAPRPADSCPRRRDRHVVDMDLVDRDMGWYAMLYPEATGEYEYKMCSGWWWCDVQGGEVAALNAAHELAEVRRQLPSLTYTAHLVSANTRRSYERGVIAKLPINAIEVINGGARTEENYDRLSETHAATGLPVKVVDE